VQRFWFCFAAKIEQISPHDFAKKKTRIEKGVPARSWTIPAPFQCCCVCDTKTSEALTESIRRCPCRKCHWWMMRLPTQPPIKDSGFRISPPCWRAKIKTLKPAICMEYISGSQRKWTQTLARKRRHYVWVWGPWVESSVSWVPGSRVPRALSSEL